MFRTRGIDESLHRINREILSLLENMDKDVYDHQKHSFNFLGKGARSRFTLLLGRALELSPSVSERIAAAAELVHTASLLHDDCVDKGTLRRGLPTLNEKLGVNTAILMGDLIVSFAFDYAVKISPEMPSELVHTVRKMTEGALLEENFRHKRLSADNSERIMALKTGSLFRWCALASARMAGRPELFEPCGAIGEMTGVIFQIVDDVLDFESPAEETGKDVLKDITEGLETMPLTLALADARYSAKIEPLLSKINTGRLKDLAPAIEIAAIVRENGFAAAARERALHKMNELSTLLGKLPNKDEAGAIKDFIYALASRTA